MAGGLFIPRGKAARLLVVGAAPPTPPPSTGSYGPRTTAIGVSSTPLTPIPSGVTVISAPANLSSAIGAGGTYLCRGNFGNQTWNVPSNAQVFGDPNVPAILDGAHSNGTAFTGNPSNTRIAGFEVRNYVPASQQSAINLYPGFQVVLENLWVHDNANIGIRVPDHSKLFRSIIEHNGAMGGSGFQSNVCEVADNIWRNNNTSGQDWTTASGESGANKWVQGDQMWFHHNESYGNNGPGVWADISNTASIWEWNNHHDNLGPGFMFEISGDARTTYIRNNRSFGNGGGHGGAEGLGILVSASQNVDVGYNLCGGNTNGLGWKEDPDQGGAPRSPGVYNFYGHDNDMTAQLSGIVLAGFAYVAGTWWTGNNNRFDYNIVSASYFRGSWQGNDSQSWAAWQGFGLDTHGVRR